MLTIFSIPKPFRGHIEIIQRNAIQSWCCLRPVCEVVLCGDEHGVAEVASGYGVKHLTEIACNEYGTPLLSSAFDRVQRIAKHQLICYVNADVIFLSDLVDAIQRVSFSRFLLVGQRWDMDVTTAIEFTPEVWEPKFKNDIRDRGMLHPPSGSDYFIFPKSVIGKLPDFAVGRPGWDNWFIYNARAHGVPVVDATKAVMAVHQNHNYAHIQAARDGSSWEGPEADRNRALIGDPARVFTLWDANWLLTPQGLSRARSPEHVRRARSTWPILYPRLVALLRAWRLILQPWRIPAAILRYARGHLERLIKFFNLNG